MSSLFGSSDYDDGGALPKGGDPELQDFLMREKQRAQFNAQIHELNDVCWDRCVEKPASKLDGRTESCLQNCVDRFIDVSLHITNRLLGIIFMRVYNPRAVNQNIRLLAHFSFHHVNRTRRKK